MLKYLNAATTFAEFPDEIALCVNITNCPGLCEHCSEPWLRKDGGKILDAEEAERLLRENPDVTLFGFMGGDADHAAVASLAHLIHASHPGMKVGMYSGMDEMDNVLKKELDRYKVGRFIMPKGPVEDWPRQACGPLCFPFSNQKYYEKEGGVWSDRTDKFRRKPLSDLTRYILT